MTGQCTGIINITIPCVNNPIYGTCQPNGQKSVTNSCDGSVTYTPCSYTPPYREAVLTSCNVTPSTLNPGQTLTVLINANTGSVDERYILRFTGDITGDSNSFWLGGTSNIIGTSTNVSFIVPSNATSGNKSYTITLIKV